MTDKKKDEYILLVFKHDGDVVDVLIDENYDKVHSAWQDLLSRWKTCIDERKPFELLKPHVTAFDPGMIKEITIRPRINTQTNNPYEQNMNQTGFAGSFPGSGMLDKGYKI